MALLYAVRSREPDVLLPEVPPALSELVLRLLRKDPSARPRDAAAVAAELEGIAATLRM